MNKPGDLKRLLKDSSLNTARICVRMKLKELSYLNDLEDVLGTYESSQIQDLKTRIGVWST